MKKLFSVLFISMFILCGCVNKNIKPEEVNNLIKTEDNYILIDVRSIGEYLSGHINTAINIPIENIEEINNKNISKDTKIIIYCQSGNRSSKAYKKLKEFGYTNVLDMKGLNDWKYELVKN